MGEIARDTKANGGYLNAGTIYHNTHYYTVLPANGFAAGLAVQADAYARSLIDAEELARELEVIIGRPSASWNDPRGDHRVALRAAARPAPEIRRWQIGRRPEAPRAHARRCGISTRSLSAVEHGARHRWRRRRRGCAGARRTGIRRDRRRSSGTSPRAPVRDADGR